MPRQPAVKSFNWVFTARGHQDLEYDSSQVKYMRWTKETGEGGYEHLQGFVGFKFQKPMSVVKRILGRDDIHVEIMKGRLSDNERYCTKQGSFDHEFGDVPADRKQAGEKRWNIARDKVRQDKVQDLEEEDFEIYTKYGKRLKEMARDRRDVKPIDGDLKDRNIWIYGEPGTGKSRLVRKTYPAKQLYLKDCNKWWDGYDDQPFVLIDDIDNKWKGINKLKNWADHYPFKPEIKGGNLGVIRPTSIIVTSNYCIHECTDGDVTLASALERRFDQVNIEELL